MRFRFSLAMAGAALSLSTVPVAAQFQCVVDAPAGGSCTVNHAVSAIVNTVALLTLSTDQTTFPVTAADFQTGLKTTPGPLISVGSNAPWKLEVSSAANAWTGGDGNKPSTDMLIKLGTGGLNPVSTALTSLATGAAGVPLLATPTELHTRWLLQSDPPGNYSLTLVFTVTAP